MIEAEAVTKTCPVCPAEVGPQPIDNFGLCRSRKDGRNLYCKACIRKKVNASRRELREFFKARKRRAREVESEPLFFDVPVPRFVRRLTPQELVKQAMRNGARTQTEIRTAARLSDDEVGDALAHLLLETREIRTEVVDNERVYLINESKEVERKPSLPASFSTVKGLMPVMKGEKKIGGWIAA